MKRENQYWKDEPSEAALAWKEFERRLILLGYGSIFVTDLVYSLELVALYSHKEPLDIASFLVLSGVNYMGKRLFPAMRKAFQ